MISTIGEGGGYEKFFPHFPEKPKKVIFFSEQIFQKMWGVEKDFSKFWGYNNWGVESKFQNSKKCSHPLTPWIGMLLECSFTKMMIFVDLISCKLEKEKLLLP